MHAGRCFISLKKINTELFGCPQFFQVVLGLSPTKAGVLLLTLIVPQVLVSWAAGYAVSRTGRFKEIISIGWVVCRILVRILHLLILKQLYTIALGVFSIVNEKSSQGMISGLLVFTAIGAGQTFQTSKYEVKSFGVKLKVVVALVALQASVEKRDVAVTSMSQCHWGFALVNMSP